MLLISCTQITKTYSLTPLFTDLSIAVSDGDKIGLIGPNGAGKSTLLHILAGQEQPDAGSVSVTKGSYVRLIEQEPSFPEGATAASCIREAVANRAEWGHLTEEEIDCRVGMALSMGHFPAPDAPAETLSGGWRKRLAISCALATEPEVLLLDEPTNALDFAGIWWLEEVLRSARFPFVMVCHDRSFLQRVVNRIVEINPCYEGGTFNSAGNYGDYLERREQYLTAQSQYRESLATKVRREVEWLRRGAKARTTKAQGRIREAGVLMEELDRVLTRTKAGDSQVGLDLTASGRQTKRLMVLKGVGHGWGERRLISELNLVLTPGMKLGLAGPNGSGKTTLLRLLAGELQPEAGQINTADNLKIVYFDQRRESLNPTHTLRQAFAPEGDHVIFRGKQVHVAAWAKRFLFSPEDLVLPVERLSGGEKARVILSRLMLREADILLLDEPTNDLDIATRDLLEENLMEFQGAVVVVSHDQYLLERICSGLLVLDGEGAVSTFADLAQWETWEKSGGSKAARDGGRDEGGAGCAGTGGGSQSQSQSQSRQQQRPPRLTYMELKELEAMEGRIEAAEAELEAARSELEDPANATKAEVLVAAFERKNMAQEVVDSLYERWSWLEEKRSLASGEKTP